MTFAFWNFLELKKIYIFHLDLVESANIESVDMAGLLSTIMTGWMQILFSAYLLQIQSEGRDFWFQFPKKIALKNKKLSKTNIPVTNCSDYPHKDCIFANFCQHHCQLQHINHYYASLTIWWEENGILLLLPFAFLSSLIDFSPP